MTKMIRLVATQACGDPQYAACIGEDSNGRFWVWLTSATTGLAKGELQASERQPLSAPPDVPKDRLLDLLAYWPAWRVIEWAHLGIGSRVLIIGAHGLVSQVAQLCRS